MKTSKMTRDTASGRDPSALTRMPATLMAEVEAWATANDVDRSDAICRLVEAGLMAMAKPTQVNATRAKELAATVIDSAASAGDQASRKSRLLKGPEEFREARLDRPKARK